MRSDVVVEVSSEWVSPSVSSLGGDVSKRDILLGSDVVLDNVWNIWAVRVLCAGSDVSGSIVVPLKVPVGKAFKLLSSDVVVRVLTEWISPLSKSGRNLMVVCSRLLSSDVILDDVWNTWGILLQGARSGVGGSIVFPFLVSISKALKLLGSNVVVEVLSEWVSPSVGKGDLSSNVMVWGVWHIWSE